MLRIPIKLDLVFYTWSGIHATCSGSDPDMFLLIREKKGYFFIKFLSETFHFYEIIIFPVQSIYLGLNMYWTTMNKPWLVYLIRSDPDPSSIVRSRQHCSETTQLASHTLPRANVVSPKLSVPAPAPVFSSSLSLLEAILWPRNRTVDPDLSEPDPNPTTWDRSDPLTLLTPV